MNISSILIIACAVFSLCSAKAGTICKPSSIFKNDCNICICGMTGLDYKCSEEKCYSKTNKETAFKDQFDNDYYIDLSNLDNDLSNENYDDDDYVNEKNNNQVASEAVDKESDTNDIGDERFGFEEATNDIDDERFNIDDAINDNDLNNDPYEENNNFKIAQDNYQYQDEGRNNEEDSSEDFNELRSRAWDKILKR